MKNKSETSYNYTENKSTSKMQIYIQSQLNLFIDMIKTYKTNYPYLIFNCKIFIEEALKGLDYRLLTFKNLYDIDYTLKFLMQHNITNESIFTKITELTNHIRKLESGNLEITYENTIQVVIETSIIIIEILYLKEKNKYNIKKDHVSTIYIDEINKKMEKHFEQIQLIIKENIEENIISIKKEKESDVQEVNGLVYFYSSGEVSLALTKRATFIDLENVTITSELINETFKKKDNEIEEVLSTNVITQSGKKVKLFIWRRWKQFKNSMKQGNKISLLNVAVRDFSAFDEVHLLEKSLLVIEPDFLINATTIANVIEKKKVCLNKYLLNLKKRNITNSNAALRGIMVGEIIDDYVLQKTKFDFEKSFKKHFREKLHKIPFLKNEFFPQEIYRQISSQVYIVDTFIWASDKSKYERPLFIEPFYISPKYGLEGRMDMMYINNSNSKIRIYELKSGKAPSSNKAPWDNHSYQTYCYKLILDSVYQYKDIVPYVLYSSSENPIRDINFDLTPELVEARNKIIAFIYNLIDEKTDRKRFIELQRNAMCFNCPAYLKSDCMKDLKLFEEELSENELDYYIGFFKLLEREKFQSRLQTSYLWKMTLAQRETMFTALSDLSIENISQGKITFRINKENNSDIRTGENVYIHRGNPVKEEIFRGSVIDIKKNNIIINLHKELPSGMEIAKWCIDRAYSTSGTNAQHSGLYKFILGNKRLKDLIFGEIKPEFRQRLGKKIKIDESLNENQKKAFDLCFKAKDYALIQGPPGTGKTYTIASIIKQFIEDGKKVLVTAYTNRSVDNILITLKNKFAYKDFVRIGSIYNIDKEIIPYTINTIIDNYDIDEIASIKEDLLSKQVFASTTTSAVTTLIFDNIKFDVVIVDEAGQMTEPSTLTVITYAKKFLLFGDDKQLPPIVTDRSYNNPFKDNEYLKSIGLRNLSKSLFERLWKLNKKWEAEANFKSTITLNMQYRMNEEIAKVSDVFFYNNIIQSHKNNKNHTLQDFKFKVPMEAGSLKSALNPLFPVCFINCKNDKASKENVTEANLVYNLVFNFLQGGIKPEQIGVIAPYKAQCALIRKYLDAIPSSINIASNILVDTVERHQGGEKDIIIVSFTVGDENMLRFLSENNEEFLLNRKLNVSITRAKRKLIIIGNSDILKLDKVYNHFILYLESKGFVYKITN